MKTAFVFPGQGAQKVGMGKDLFDSSDRVKNIFKQADNALDEDFQKLIFEGPADDLTLTANTQPAILTVSIAALEAFKEITDIKPDFVAGHSLGEFSALVANGMLDFSDAVKITRARGTYMQEAVPAGKGAMAAVMKLEEDIITQACIEASKGEIVSPANFNCPGQIVISGDFNAVERASVLLKEQGGRIIPLKVSAPFHCELMAPAADKLNKYLRTITIGSADYPLVTNVDAAPNSDSERVKELLVKQVTSTVKWTDSIKYIISQGVDTFFEFGPGSVLAGLISKIDPNVTVISINSVSGLDKARELLEKTS
ncbi:MAG: ACP S-malonyltransferase [Deltaproteobacteria bacterium]|nr:ACP S-malonyltransferase [Deltaproteobacteria bacterium]